VLSEITRRSETDQAAPSDCNMCGRYGSVSPRSWKRLRDAQDLNARKHGSIEHQVLRKMFYWLPTRLRKLRTPELSCAAYCGVTGKKRERLMGRVQEAKSEFDVSFSA
jgi:hypothetical protein